MAVVDTFKVKRNSGVSTLPIQGGSRPLQGGTGSIQGSGRSIQGSSPSLQVTANPMNYRLVEPGAAAEPAAPTYDPAAAAAAAAAAKIAGLRGEIKGQLPAIIAAYNALFGDVRNLAKAQSQKVEEQAGENITDLTGQYTSSIPKIQSSYAAVGAGDSTDTRDAKITAKEGFDKSVKQVGEQKDEDLAKIGQYVDENMANWNADKNSILRLIGRVDQTDDEGDLNEARNNVENKLDTLGATRATLSTEKGARGKLSQITADNGRFDAIKGALDNIVNSSLSGGVKAAAVQAVQDSTGLSEQDRQKVKQMYGDVYNAPVA